MRYAASSAELMLGRGRDEVDAWLASAVRLGLGAAGDADRDGDGSGRGLDGGADEVIDAAGEGDGWVEAGATAPLHAARIVTNATKGTNRIDRTAMCRPLDEVLIVDSRQRWPRDVPGPCVPTTTAEVLATTQPHNRSI